MPIFNILLFDYRRIFFLIHYSLDISFFYIYFEEIIF